MRIVLADSLPLVRSGLRALLEGLPGMAVVVIGETGDGQELLQLVGSLRPDLAIIELRLETLNGIDTLRQLRRHYPEVPVLVLSEQQEGSQVRAALKAGAAGYLSKHGDVAELALALKAVMRKQTYLSPGVADRVVGQRRSARAEDSVTLPRRQQQVLRLIARGRSTKEIAQLMGISSKTVETHRARMMETLGLHGTNALMRYAIRNGLEGADAG